MNQGETQPLVPDGQGTMPCALNKTETQDAPNETREDPADDPEKPPKAPRAPRPGACHTFVRSQVAKALPRICVALVDKAAEGDLTVTKLLWQMAELDRQAESPTDRSADKRFARQTLAMYCRRKRAHAGD